MNKMYAALLSAYLLVLSFSANGQTNDAPVKTISSLDVQRYMGTWYEIAKYPNWFQRKCIGNTKAVYSSRADGTLKVLNSCKSADGNLLEAEGTARQIGAKDSLKLEVRFAPAWLSFLPLVWGDYWVIDLDSQDQEAELLVTPAESASGFFLELLNWIRRLTKRFCSVFKINNLMYVN